MKQESQALEEAARKALDRRLASGAVLTYELDDWVVEEHPGGRIKRLTPMGGVSGGGVPLPRLHAACSLSRLIVYASANGEGKSTLRDAAADAVDIEIDADRIAR